MDFQSDATSFCEPSSSKNPSNKNISLSLKNVGIESHQLNFEAESRGKISENPGPIGVFESACDRDKKNVLKCITDTLYYVGTLLLTFYA